MSVVTPLVPNGGRRPYGRLFPHRKPWVLWGSLVALFCLHRSLCELAAWIAAPPRKMMVAGCCLPPLGLLVFVATVLAVCSHGLYRQPAAGPLVRPMMHTAALACAGTVQLTLGLWHTGTRRAEAPILGAALDPVNAVLFLYAVCLAVNPVRRNIWNLLCIMPIIVGGQFLILGLAYP